jgi:hypothetical protein
MPNRADLRNWVREQTLLESDDISNDLVNDWLDQAHREVAARFDWAWLATSSTLSVVAEQQAYPLPADLGRIEAVVSNTKRRRLHEESPSKVWSSYGGVSTFGEPRSFYVWGNNLHLVPVPSASETDAFTIYYYGSPNLMGSDTATPEFDPRFHVLLAVYAVGLAWQREEEYAKAERAFDEFSDGIDRMARHYLDRANDYPMIMGATPVRGRSIRDLLEETSG